MDKEEVVDFLQERLDNIIATEPYAVNAIAAYEAVINDLGNDD